MPCRPRTRKSRASSTSGWKPFPVMSAKSITRPQVRFFIRRCWPAAPPTTSFQASISGSGRSGTTSGRGLATSVLRLRKARCWHRRTVRWRSSSRRGPVPDIKRTASRFHGPAAPPWCFKICGWLAVHAFAHVAQSRRAADQPRKAGREGVVG